MSKLKKDIIEELENLKVEFDEEDTQENLVKLLKEAKKDGDEEKPEKGKEKKARYISKGLNFKIVRKSAYTKEVDGKVVVVSGNSIQFKQGLYETDDPEEIKFLDNHGDCGGYFIKVKTKDLANARSEKFKSLEEKEKELKAKEEELDKKEKSLAEEESSSKKGEKSKKSKKEKPAF